MGLTEIVTAEFEKVLIQAERAYETLDMYVGTFNPQKRNALIKDIQTSKRIIKSARAEFDKATTIRSSDFSPETVASLRKSYNLLEKGIPDNEGMIRISDAVLELLDSQPISKKYNEIRNNLAGISVISALSAPISLYYFDNPVACAIYTVGAAVGVWSVISKKDSISRAVIPNLGLVLGAGALVFPNMISDLGRYTGSHPWLYMCTALAHFPGYLAVDSLIKYKTVRNFFDTKVKAAKSARVRLDNFVRAGIAITEAHNNLRYVQSVIQSEGREKDAFKPQIEVLEDTLVRYVLGEATHNDVLEARVKYVPKGIIKSSQTKQQIAVSKKNGLSAQEYERLKQKRDEGAIPTQHDILAEKSIRESYEQSASIQVNFSHKLQDLYETKEQVGGYTYGPLMDLTQEKLENNPKGTPIKEGTGRHLLTKLRKKHGLSNDVRVYKMQPIGALRTLYTLQAGKIQVLDILTHTDYDRMLKP